MEQVEARAPAVKEEEDDGHALKGDNEKIEDTVEISSGKTSQILVDKKKEEEDDQQEQPLSLLLTGEFGNNDTKVLQLLNEAGSNYSFKGLMRKLNLHQQSLSRALHRLQEMGLVERTASGYKLGSVISTINNSVRQTTARRPKGIEYTQLLQTFVPGNVKSADVIRQLIGKWFKNMRWLGMIESETGHTLQWTSEDGSFQINLRLISDYVIIETNASTEKEKVQAMSGSYAIYEQITRAVQSRLLAAATNSSSLFRLDYHGSVNN
jgi:DNA-binding HxlR family transcriptional regulator